MEIFMSALNFLPLSSNLISTNTAESTATTFTLDNNSNESLNLYWIDTSGNAQLYKTLTPGQTCEQLTQTTHVWEVTSADGAVGFKFEDTSQGIITVGTNNQPTFTDQSERIVSTPQGLWSTRTTTRRWTPSARPLPGLLAIPAKASRSLWWTWALLQTQK